MNTTNVHGTFREMWETRPARPRDDRQIAGVAAAIARRYDIDPVLVRVGFVVAAFFGIGAALYIAGWLVLPDTPADPSVPEGRKRGILVVGLVIATIAFTLAPAIRAWRRESVFADDKFVTRLSAFLKSPTTKTKKAR
jgi:phage shock protein PspC (stress-responsive transcriptional regulator)